jgi:hypothetical protein
MIIFARKPTETREISGVPSRNWKDCIVQSGEKSCSQILTTTIKYVLTTLTNQ